MTMRARSSARHLMMAGLATITLAACTPTIKVEAPDKPIVINLNIKIEQEVRIRVDKDVDQAITAKPGIF